MTKNNSIKLSLTVLTELLLLFIDSITPLGSIEWIYYLIPIFFIATRFNSSFAYSNTLLVTLLIAIGFYLSPAGIEERIGLVNRILGIFVLWIKTVLIVKNRKTEEKLKEKELIERNAIELKKLNEELEQINLSKDKFFSIIAHDLRSPFTALLGFSEYLTKNIKDLTNEEIKDFAERIYLSLNRLLRLIENLLQWSQFQIGKTEFIPGIFSLNQLINDVIDIYQINIFKKKIQIEVNIDHEMKIYGDKEMIKTVLRNLLSNAIKFSFPEGIIRISAENKKTFCEVSITDNGKGIDENDIQKLFKIGEKVTSVGTNDEKGTGLGLILCKEFIEANKGSLWVESSSAKGSVFKFIIPVPTS